VYVAEVPPGANLTALVLRYLSLPPEAERVIFRTDSTTKRLMERTAFDSSYTGLTPGEDGSGRHRNKSKKGEEQGSQGKGLSVAWELAGMRRGGK
jgi:hypothetical protein